MNHEAFLYYIWTYYLLGKQLQTVDGKKIVVLNIGERNVNSGPDFFNAQVKVDGIVWAGNVEIHRNSSDWFKHKHQYDEAYDNIVLHVVYEYDIPVYRHDGFRIPCLELKGKIDDRMYEVYQRFQLSKQWISCASDISKVEYLYLYSWLQRLAVERIEEKAATIREKMSHNKGNLQEVFYHTLMRAYGFSVNSDAFEQLALSLPYQILLKHKNDLLQLEALLLGQAGLLPEKSKEPYVQQLKAEYNFLAGKYELKPLPNFVLKYMRLRPSNFPTLRLAQLAQLIYRTSGLLHSILTTEDMKAVYDLFTARTSGFWSTHYSFKKSHALRPKRMGKESIYSLFINTIIPFIFVYGDETDNAELKEKALNWLAKIPAEHNNVVRNFNKVGVCVQHANQSQGLLQLKSNYCSQKRCLECSIGHYLIQTSSV